MFMVVEQVKSQPVIVGLKIHQNQNIEQTFYGLMNQVH